MNTGRILHIQRLSTEDGPGIRTTVFFKGCPLHCSWCHNPESISVRPQTQWFTNRCLRCLTCLEACPNGCIAMTEHGQVVDRTRCQGCFRCVDACPANAIEPLGRVVQDDTLVNELLKDRAYFERSDGGVTLSGGEPTMQPDLAEALLRGLKNHAIHTALDTCGFCTSRTLERLLPFTDLVLYDLKFLDPEQHSFHTGQRNELILDNLLWIRDCMLQKNQPSKLWIRTPLIPDATAVSDNLKRIGRFISEKMDGLVSRWELCAFNNLCRDQYLRLGLEWKYAQQPLLSSHELAHWEQTARSSVLIPEIVLASGATRRA